VQAPQFPNHFVAGSKVQVVSVGQQDLNLEIFQLVLRHPFHRARRATGMKIGVSTTPWGVVSIPARAREPESFATTLNAILMASGSLEEELSLWQGVNSGRQVVMHPGSAACQGSGPEKPLAGGANIAVECLRSGKSRNARPQVP